jgi:hypothetical protein
MTQENGQLPLFGKITFQDLDLNHNPTISRSDFFWWTNFIDWLFHFSCSDHSTKSFHLALGLILCWYKKQENRVIFDQKFPDESTYWNTMIGILERMYSVGSYFSSKKLLILFQSDFNLFLPHLFKLFQIFEPTQCNNLWEQLCCFLVWWIGHGCATNIWSSSNYLFM